MRRGRSSFAEQSRAFSHQSTEPLFIDSINGTRKVIFSAGNSHSGRRWRESHNLPAFPRTARAGPRSGKGGRTRHPSRAGGRGWRRAEEGRGGEEGVMTWTYRRSALTKTHKRYI